MCLFSRHFFRRYAQSILQILQYKARTKVCAIDIIIVEILYTLYTLKFCFYSLRFNRFLSKWKCSCLDRFLLLLLLQPVHQAEIEVDEALRETVEKMDANDDGKVSYEEFLALEFQIALRRIEDEKKKSMFDED